MSGRTPPLRPAGSFRRHGVELLERAAGYARVSLALVSSEQLAAPTPCAAWDLRSLLVHLEDSLSSVHAACHAGLVGLEDRPPHEEDPIAGLAPVLGDLLADCAADQAAPRHPVVLVGARPLGSGVVAAAGALEVAVHGWDVAAACGAPRPIPDLLAADLLRVAPLLVNEADRPARFAEAVPPPAGATPGDVLLAFLGRRSR